MWPATVCLGLFSSKWLCIACVVWTPDQISAYNTASCNAKKKKKKEMSV